MTGLTKEEYVLYLKSVDDEVKGAILEHTKVLYFNFIPRWTVFFIYVTYFLMLLYLVNKYWWQEDEPSQKNITEKKMPSFQQLPKENQAKAILKVLTKHMMMKAAAESER